MGCFFSSSGSSSSSSFVYACRDPRVGAIGSIYNLADDTRFNHRVQVREGILQAECSHQLSDFFRRLREAKKELKKHN